MAFESWTVDGYNLSSLAHDIETYDGLDEVPDRKSADVDIPQLHGVIPGIPYFTDGRKAVAMQVSTTDPATGVDPVAADAKRANFDHNLDKLVRIFYRRNLLDVRRTLSDGTVRQAFCRTVTGIKPTRVGLSAGRAVFDLQLPYSFWQDVANTVQTSTAWNAGNVNFSSFASATAPMSNLVYTIRGPVTNPMVIDVESNAWVQYVGAVAAGADLVLDSGAQSVVGGTAASMNHDGDPSWLTLHPSVNGALISMTGSGTTGATTLTVTGRRKFLR